MFDLAFNLSALLNAVLGGSIGAGLTWLIGRGYQRRLYQAVRTTARLAVFAAREPDATDIAFDEKGWPVGVKFSQEMKSTLQLGNSVTVEVDREEEGPATNP